MPGPDSWTVATAAPAGSTQMQLTPPTGLDSSTTLVIAGALYQVTQAQGGLVTIDPPLAQAVQVNDPVTRLDRSRPSAAACSAICRCTLCTSAASRC